MFWLFSDVHKLVRGIITVNRTLRTTSKHESEISRRTINVLILGWTSCNIVRCCSVVQVNTSTFCGAHVWPRISWIDIILKRPSLFLDVRSRKNASIRKWRRAQERASFLTHVTRVSVPVGDDVLSWRTSKSTRVSTRLVRPYAVSLNRVKRAYR